MTKEEAKKILAEYVKACREDDMLTLEQFTYEEVIEAMDIGAEAISVLPVSSNPDKAAEEYVSTLCGRADEGLRIDTTLESAFKAGSKWDREQIMKEAVECDVIVPIYEGNDVWSAEIKIPGRYEPGDKVRVIIVKEN